MAQNYGTLSAYMQGHKSNPLALAKTMVSWIWASVEAKNGPSNVSEVVSMLKGACGWRDTLLESLFKEIGIEHRRANFYDVPIQSNHSATELLIDGKWMFFDATTGLYFTLKGSSTPISIEEARDNWANVVVHKSTLDGWQGKFLDPGKIDPNGFETYDDVFLYVPKGFYAVDNVISAELFTIYFGPKASYLDDGLTIAKADPSRSWKTFVDSSHAKAWSTQTNIYDAAGRLEANYMRLDDNSHRFKHVDRSNKYDWWTMTTFVTAHSHVERQIIVNDDKSRIDHSFDETGSAPWREHTIVYAPNKATDYEAFANRDGTSLIREYDEFNIAGWQSYEDLVGADGTTIRTIVTQDDGSTVTYDWSSAPKIAGTAADELLGGTGGVDAIFGGAGSDTLDGGPGVDRLEGGAGNDVYYADEVGEMVVERTDGGRDTVFASTNYILNREVETLILTGDAIYGTGNSLNNTIAGNAHDNILTGNAGNDRLVGDIGADILTGGAGRDTIEGGPGSDTLMGGAGNDVFLWRNIDETAPSKAGSDLVKDFASWQGDVLNLRLIDADATRAGNQNFHFVGQAAFSGPAEIRYAFAHGQTWIYLNTDSDSAPEGVIRLAGTHAAEAGWFVL